MKNEHTRAAKIAGLVLARFARTKCREIALVNLYDAGETYELASWSDIRALASFVAHHADDHADLATIRKGHLPRGHKRIKTHKPIVRNGKMRK